MSELDEMVECIKQPEEYWDSVVDELNDANENLIDE